MNRQLQRELDIFAAALQMHDAGQREAYLTEACGGDIQLRQRIEGLLRAHEDAGSFLNCPATAPSGRGGTVLMPVTERPGDRIGRYKLREKVGEGGCGVVYVAEQEEPVRRRVALKVIKLGMDSKSVVARFEAERQALAMMDHPNIAKVLDAGATDAGRPYFVMELVRGIKITDYCDQNNLSTGERLDLFIKVCHAIQHAHQKGIIHRDIKPSNILVTLHDGVPVPKVIDFGIAKATESRLTDLTIYTELHQFIGTPAYISPEQAEMSGLDIDTRADIYSLGVLLYELLTGKTPFSSEELLRAGFDEMRRTIREREPVRPSTRLSTMLEGELTATAKRHGADAPKLLHLIRGDLDWIVMKALEKDRARRYESATGFAHDIRRFLESEPVVARPPSATYRFQKFVRRNKLAFAAASATAAAMLIGLCVATVSLVRERKAREVAVEARAAEEKHRKMAIEQQKLADEQRRLAEQSLYDSDMLLVQQALAESNNGRAVQLLNRYVPTDSTNNSLAPGLKVSRDLRGWEWRYFARETESDELLDLDRSGSGDSLAFSADGTILASPSMESLVVWNVNPRRKIAEIPQAVGHVAISSDGLLAAITVKDIRLWDLTRNNAPLAPLSHSEQLRSLAFSPDGRTLAAVGPNHLWLWDIPARRATVIDIADGWRLAFSPDGKTLAVAQKMTGQVVLWDWVRNVETARLPSARYEGGWTGSLAFSPDGRFLAAAFGPTNRTIKVLDVAARAVLTNLVGHAGIVCAAVFADGGKILASCSGDQTIKLWDVATWTLIRTLKGHRDEVVALGVSPDGTLLASRDKGGAMKFWKVTSQRIPEPFKYFAETKDTWPAVRAHWGLSSDGRYCLTAHTNGTFRVWDTATLQVLTEASLPCTNVTRVAIASSKLMAFGDGNELLRIGCPGSFYSLALPSGMATNIGGAVLDSNLWGMAFSSDGKKLAALCGNLTVTVWDTTSRHLIARFNGPRADPELLAETAILAFSPNNELLAVSFTKSSSLVVWDLIANREKRRFPRRGSTPLIDCTFSPDGEQIATTCADGTVKLWNLNDQDEPLLPILVGFQSGMQMAVAFSPDGKRLATAGGDPPSIKIWDMETRQEVARLKEELDFFPKLAFLPDGDTLIAASQQALRVWRAAKLSKTENEGSGK